MGVCWLGIVVFRWKSFVSNGRPVTWISVVVRFVGVLGQMLLFVVMMKKVVRFVVRGEINLVLQLVDVVNDVLEKGIGQSRANMFGSFLG